ncbi:MAG TPA: metallophosphoesterase family protein [Bacillales bacterium]|nr:metallophosphoesterase family protein [Bacillales bacterium]
MKIGLVSDTHMPGHGKELPEVLKEGLRGVDLIIHAGDWQTLDVYDSFREIAPVEGVAGNVDGNEVISRFRQKKLLELEGYRIGVVHGHLGKGRTTPERALRTFEGEHVDLVIFGHSHIPFDDEIEGVRLFNPGSPTDKRRQPEFSYGLLTLGDSLSLQHVYYKDKF